MPDSAVKPETGLGKAAWRMRHMTGRMYGAKCRPGPARAALLDALQGADSDDERSDLLYMYLRVCRARLRGDALARATANLRPQQPDASHSIGDGADALHLQAFW